MIRSFEARVIWGGRPVMKIKSMSDLSILSQAGLIVIGRKEPPKRPRMYLKALRLMNRKYPTEVVSWSLAKCLEAKHAKEQEVKENG